MPDIKKIQVSGTVYNVADETARTNIASVQDDIDTLIDLSSYAQGAIVPALVVANLEGHKAHVRVKYNHRIYIPNAQFSSETISDAITFVSIDTSGDDALQVITITKAVGASDYLLHYGSADVATYTNTGLLALKLEPTTNKLVLQSTTGSIDLIKNSAQEDNIQLTLPSVSGTLALVGQGGDVTREKIVELLGYNPYSDQNPAGYISGISAQMVETALGYVPYSSENPSGYISDYTVTQQDVTSALGFTPYSAANPAGYISGITGAQVSSALGYIPYDSANPNEYITGISSSDVTTALGYTPYNATNPNNYVTANVNNLNNYYTKTAVDGMVANRFQAKIVQALPTSGISTSTIYMVLQAGQTDIYDEYMYIENNWVKIGTTSIDMSEYAKVTELHNVALTGAYSSLVGKPTIPTNTSDLSNDSGFITNAVDNLANYPKTTDLSAVAYSGSYNDLSNRPTIPTTVSQLTNDSGYVTPANLASTNISTFINNVPYATLNDIRGLEDIDVEEIKKAIAAMEHIGTVTWVAGGTGLTGGGNTNVGERVFFAENVPVREGLNIGNDSYRKANSAYAYGGPKQAINMLNMNFDLNITDYVTVGWGAVADTVDALGGVTIDVDSAEITHLNNYQVETSQSLGRSYKKLGTTGMVNLDGIQAVSYCRIRYTAGDDYKRAERQREVIQALADKAQSVALTNPMALNTVVDKVFPQTATSLSKAEILELLTDVASYKIVDTTGYPNEQYRSTGIVGGNGDCVIPSDLATNVTLMHEFLFGETGYQPSSEVQSYSAKIRSNTGK